ncbi:MAG TPA: PaaI family thioesterase, partial [Candidatus Omnitrophota bacterium]|nr:PaaI family thioesterase [Candidatus Omnitrophota bacterium]
DYAFALAANSGETPGLGINAGIQFTKAGRPGDELFAEAELVSRSRKLGTYRIVVTDQEGAVLASAQAMAYFK